MPVLSPRSWTKESFPRCNQTQVINFNWMILTVVFGVDFMLVELPLWHFDVRLFFIRSAKNFLFLAEQTVIVSFISQSKESKFIRLSGL